MTPTPKVLVGAALALALAGCGAAEAVVGLHDAPAQVTTTAPIAPDTAEQIATRVLDQADEASRATGDKADALRKQALTGSALAVAEAAAKSEDGTSAADAPLTRSTPPKVLAVSRGTAWPRVMVVQTAGKDGATELNLLTSPDPATPFKLAASARMHPGATVAALDSLRSGSPLVTDGADLSVPPDKLVQEYAGALAYPKASPAPDVETGDPFALAVRANAAAQAKSFGKLATLTQKHVPQPGTTAIRLKDGGALVFALMQRTDAITLSKGGKSLTASADFQKLVRKKTLTRSAQLQTYEMVVFTVPAQGKAKMVAVDEVLSSAKGS
ncbi:hypothetical protein [Phycicoccus sp. 3266]|uniref:hypothetical protein n=1 Tax=Phycicoccus sp. 3266 TaxID=2817751 RepID=UPI002854C87C|nr:hypothetical protein [Phycicoccus sp. 3266]MDR6862131.1 hypothetical protein [Phycicoccus sp. 3266]